jgi:hypothetical protein
MVNNKSKTTSKGQLSIKKRSSKYPFPKKYYQGLSKKDKERQIKELEKSKELYKKGVFIGRSKKSSFKSQKSAHIVEFEEKYGININDKKGVYKSTGITPKAQDEIIGKGMGAFYSSGSRPNQSAQSWALARLASVILKHGAYKVDRHILIKYKCDNIKKPKKSKSKSQRGSGGKQTRNIISCCEINDKNEHKYKKCLRKSDGGIFKLPRKFNRTSCKRIRGFTMKSSCAIYDSC